MSGVSAAFSTVRRPSTQLSKSAWRLPAFIFTALLAFLTGAVSLGQGFIRLREAGRLLGAEGIALSAVPPFLLGLAVGGAAAGWGLRSHRRSPLLLCGLLQLVLGAYGLAFPWLCSQLETLWA